MNFKTMGSATLLVCALTVGGAVATAPAAQAAPAATACAPAKTPAYTAKLATLTDPSGITTYDDAASKISELRKEISTSDNYLGTFPIAFDNILDLVGPSLDSGRYEDTEWATALAVEVVKLYLGGLHDYVTGAAGERHWNEALALTDDCDRSPGRVLLGQIFAHLVVDFPRALVNIDTTQAHTKDFFTFGDALVEATPAIIADVKKVYGVDLEPLLTGWFLGDIVGDTQATTFMFQSVRTIAFANSFALSNPATHDITEAEMYAVFQAANVFLDGLEAVGQI